MPPESPGKARVHLRKGRADLDLCVIARASARVREHEADREGRAQGSDVSLGPAGRVAVPDLLALVVEDLDVERAIERLEADARALARARREDEPVGAVGGARGERPQADDRRERHGHGGEIGPVGARAQVVLEAERIERDRSRQGQQESTDSDEPAVQDDDSPSGQRATGR